MTFSERIAAAAIHNEMVSKREEAAQQKISKFFKYLKWTILGGLILLAGRAVLLPGDRDYRPAIFTATQNVVWCRQQTPSYQSLSYCTAQEKKLEQLWEWDEKQRVKDRK